MSTRPARKAPPGIGRASSKIIARLSPHNAALDPGLIAHWDQIAGEKLAALCRPTRLYRDGYLRILEVTASHGAAATYLQFHLTSLCNSVNAYLGGSDAARAIAQIRVSQHGGRGARRRSVRGMPVSGKNATGGAVYSTSAYAERRRAEARQRGGAHQNGMREGGAGAGGAAKAGMAVRPMPAGATSKEIGADFRGMKGADAAGQSPACADLPARPMPPEGRPAPQPALPPYEKGNLHNALSRLKVLGSRAQERVKYT